MKPMIRHASVIILMLSLFCFEQSWATVSNVQKLIGGKLNLSGEGTLVQAYNLGTTSSSIVSGVGTFTGDTGVDGVAGAARLAPIGSTTLAATNTGTAIDDLFFSETNSVSTSSGYGISLTYTLPDTAGYLVEILHGEPGAKLGTFDTVTFSDAGGTVAVPSFTLGNNIADTTPANGDWVIIRAKVQGVSQFTYTMPNGTGRGASISGFQVRRLTVSTPTDTEPFISEISAAGNTTYLDEDGDTPDWIEIYNPTGAIINLNGWHLTNLATNTSLWTFPSVTLRSGNSLVVFASSKNRAVAGANLHTSFKLPASGGYLALTKPDGTVVHSFAPYPAQTDGFTYGIDGFSRISPSAFFNPPTPGSKNGIGMSAAIEAPVFSVKKATFTTTQAVSISTTFPNGQIRYTTDGSVPTATSTLYTGPLSFSTTTQLRAQVFNPLNNLAGAVDTAFFTKLAITSNLTNIPAPTALNSNLPVLIIENFAAGAIPGSEQPLQFANLTVFEPDPITGRTVLNRTPDKSVRAGLRIRGQTSADFAKKQYKLEIWNEANGDKDEALLGLSSESDWVLNGPGGEDESLIRNTLVYSLGKDVDIPAPGTRYCEMFLNTDGGPITSADYVGVYILMEKIKIGKNRLDLTDPNDFPDNDGGYIMRHECEVANQSLITGGWRYCEVHDPLPTAAQLTFISGKVNGFNTALRSTDFKNPLTGYPAWADAGSFARYAVLTEFVRAQDSYVRSAYFYKDRGQKLKAGPLWDYDLSLGIASAGGIGSFNTGIDPSSGSGWQFDKGYNMGSIENYMSEIGQPSTSLTRLDWTRLMMKDPDFKQLFIDKWQQLRTGVLSTAGLAARINTFTVELTDSGATTSPQKRNTIRWGGGTWTSHVNTLKTWASDRSAWMDSQFTPMPVANIPAGSVNPGTVLTLTSAHTVYATLNGTDPRLSGGQANPLATALVSGGSQSLTLNATSHLMARARSATGEWSAPLDLWYIVNQVATPASLIVSELHYHPSDPTVTEQLPDASLTDDDFEFIELKNISGTTLDLSGASFVIGIDYTFPAGSLMNPGATWVLASNTVAFTRRYGAGISVFGEYIGQLENSGERIVMQYNFGSPIIDFSWVDTWHTPTDGGGYSLVALNQNIAANANLASSWAISPQIGASPGTSTDGYSLTFESWLHYHFTSGEQLLPNLIGNQDDPDGDSLNNLIEYALGTNPRANTPPTELPQIGNTTIGSNVFLSLTWTRPVGILDITYTPEFTSNLTNWTQESVFVTTTNSSGKETITYRGIVPRTSQSPSFTRLKVNKP